MNLVGDSKSKNSLIVDDEFYDSLGTKDVKWALSSVHGHRLQQTQQAYYVVPVKVSYENRAIFVQTEARAQSRPLSPFAAIKDGELVFIFDSRAGKPSVLRWDCRSRSEKNNLEIDQAGFSYSPEDADCPSKISVNVYEVLLLNLK